MNKTINRMKSICKYLSKKYNELTIKSEDASVVKFLKQVNIKSGGSYIEIGSGLGRFIKVVKSLDKFDIQCLEINSKLAEITLNLGYKTFNVSLLDNVIPSNKFDIVHCSHVVEHIAYPNIIKALDELIRITKKAAI